MLKFFYPDGEGWQSWCKDCLQKNRSSRKGGPQGYTPRLRRIVGRQRITEFRDKELRARVASFFAQTPMSTHEDSLAAALLDALDDLRDARSMCFRLRATVRAHVRRIA